MTFKFKTNCFTKSRFTKIGIVIFALLFAGMGRYFTFKTSAATAINATVDLSTSTGISNLSPGVTNTDTSLFYNWGSNDTTAVDNVTKNLIPNGVPFYNTHIMAWGSDDPWPDPTQPSPTNWGTLDNKMLDYTNAKAVNPNEQAVITLMNAPWWMKGQLQSNGTTTLIPDGQGDFGSHTYSSSFTDYRGITYPAGYASPDPYGSRILDNQMNNWLTLVEAVARRYMVAPYNVRYFQVWNEMKGYYNPATNQWDYTTNCGDASGYNAKEGYTCMYNQVYSRIMSVATSLGIPTNTINVGGPYNVINTWADTGAGGFPTTETALQNKSYGTYDQRDADVVKYWLQNKTGAGFITVDGDNGNHDGTNLTDPFTASQKFADVVSWIRSLNNTTYPGAQTLPIWWAEWYADPYTNITDDYNNAVKSYAIAKLLEAGGAVPLEWGGVGEGTNATGLWTQTTAGGGQPLAWYNSYKAFNDYFPPGTTIYKTTVSDPTQLEVLASASKSMLINKTNSALAVTLNGSQVALNPYQVSVVNTPSGAIPGDINGDGHVTIVDLSLLLSSYGSSNSACVTAPQYICDLNSSDGVTIIDLSILLSHFGV